MSELVSLPAEDPDGAAPAEAALVAALHEEDAVLEGWLAAGKSA